MIKNDNFIKAMKFDYPDVIPVTVSFLPATWMKYREGLNCLIQRHPAIFGENIGTKRNYDEEPETYREGTHIDSWGCVWYNIREGCEAIVKHHPVPTREAVHNLRAPAVDAGIPHGFMYLRLADLRGFEEIMVDFAEEPPELQMLIDIVLAYNMRQLELRLNRDKSEVIYFGDDLGMQHSLPISPEKWRKYLKPCFTKIFTRCHEDKRYVYMHSDGQIYQIIPDLIDCGVNIINAQFRANGIDNLSKTCKGRVCLDLDLDRQMFPFCKPSDIDGHIREAVEKLGSPKGGLMLSAECGPDVPYENIEAICNALEKYSMYYA